MASQLDFFGQPQGEVCPDAEKRAQEALQASVQDSLHRQLVRLGDMMGDGLHHEPDGRWIGKEYRRVAKALGYGPMRANNSDAINTAMTKALATMRCQCGAELRQTRAGALRAECVACAKKYQFKPARRGKS